MLQQRLLTFFFFFFGLREAAVASHYHVPLVAAAEATMFKLAPLACDRYTQSKGGVRSMIICNSGLPASSAVEHEEFTSVTD